MMQNSLCPNPAGQSPRIARNVFVHESARIIGNVSVGGGAFIGPLAVIRADERDKRGRVRPIRIGPACNVQDGAILHALGGTGIDVGRGTSISHGAVVHGPAKCGTDCFIGFRAVVFKASLGDGVYIGMGAIVLNVRLRARTLVPAGCVIARQKDTESLGRVGPGEKAFMRKVSRANAALGRAYLRLAGPPPSGRRPRRGG